MNKKRRVFKGTQGTFRGVLVPVFLIFIAVATVGCVNLLEDYVETITEHHIPPYIRPPIVQTIVADYYELFAIIIDLIIEHETESQVLYQHSDGEDVIAVVQQVRNEILNQHPLGAYAVADITIDATRIVTYYEVDIEIEYMRTQEQLEAIINIPSERHLRTQLLMIMSEYREYAVFRTGLQITEDDIVELVRELYYQNPRRIVILPFVTVEKYPEEGEDRIYEIQFGLFQNRRMLQLYSETLVESVRQVADRTEGETESEIILSLVRDLMASTVFNEGVAGAMIMHGGQNLAATAFGVMVRGSAVGEGFAMAFKALCDELGIECHVVLGYLDGRVHAWNIVYLYGFYYHIDVAMSAVHGIETAFLKTDADFEEMLYTWDRENTVRCEGELTLDDIIGIEDYDDYEDIDEPDEESNNDNEEENNEFE